MTRDEAKRRLSVKFKFDDKKAGLIIDFLEGIIGMHPPTHSTRSWVTHYIEEWEVSETGSEPEK